MLSSNSSPIGVEVRVLIMLVLLIKHLQQKVYNSLDTNCPLPSGRVRCCHLAKQSILPGEGAARPGDSRLACSDFLLLWGWQLQHVLKAPVHSLQLLHCCFIHGHCLAASQEQRCHSKSWMEAVNQPGQPGTGSAEVTDARSVWEGSPVLLCLSLPWDIPIWL